jgi:predicted ATPase
MYDMRQNAWMRSPLVLTGGPAVGKSTTARFLALATDRAAVVDVDDVRQLVVSGGAAPWEGPEGLAQQRLGVENGCLLGRNFQAADFDVILTDVITPVTLELYRQRLSGCLIVRLHVSAPEAQRRAATRTVYLTDPEFTQLHDQDRDDPPPADYDLDVTDLTIAEQVAAVTGLWTNSS